MTSMNVDGARRARGWCLTFAFGLLGLFAGCTSPATDGDPAVNNDEVNGAGTKMTLKAPSFTVPPGGDITRCTAVRGTNAAAAFTNRFSSKQAGHHHSLFTVDHPIEPGSFECPQGGQWNWTNIYASQKQDREYKLPDGVGYKLEPNQQFVIETHVINATDKPIEAASEVTIDFVEPSAVKYPAGSIVVGTTNIALPPHATGQAGVTCTMPADLHVSGLFGHTHGRGTQLSVSRVTNGVAEKPFYAMDSWDDPKILDRIDFKTGDVLRVGCDYVNESDRKLGYPDEMCRATGIYWPANAQLVCESYGDNPTCNCYQPVNKELGAGGSSITLEVSRAASIPGAKGDVSEGRPVYCYAYRKEDMDRDGPFKAKLAYWSGGAPDAKPLATEADKVTIKLYDVTPGEYVATCAMDTIYGGYFPGSGAPIVFPYVPITVGAAAAPPVALQLNMAKP